MTPAARLAASIELLGFIGTSPVPMDTVIGDYMRARRYIGSKDRADIAERLYGIARAEMRLCWHLERCGAASTPRALLLAWLALAERTGLPALSSGAAYGPDAPDEAEKNLIRTLHDSPGLNHPDMPEAVRVECPPAHEPVLRALFGDSFAAEMEAMLSPAPLDLRVNTAKQSREEVRESLRRDGVETDETPFSPAGLRARGKAYLAKTKAFSKGWIAIQDEGSQLIALLCGAQPGNQVLDLCAGAGGKTLALADAMRGKGRIVAADIDARRLEKARPRFRSAGVSDIIEVRALGDDRHRKWLKRQKGTFDIVLADVPCSGTGTWRRNPDLRLRPHGPPPAELVPVQAEILDKAAKAVKPGGRLVYATCSLLPEENEDQVAAFLARNGDFTLQRPDVPWAQGSAMRLSPLRHGTDGFFAAIMTRRPDAPPEPPAP